MPSWFRGLQFRLILAFTLTIALAVGSVGALVSSMAAIEINRFEARSQEFRVGRVHGMIARHYEENQDWSGVQPSLEQAGSFYGRRFVLTDSDGEVIADSHRQEGKKRFGRHLRSSGVPVEVEGQAVGFLAAGPGRLNGQDEDGQPLGAAVVLPPPSGQDREPLISLVAAAVNKSLLWTGLIASIGGILVLSLVSRRILAPVHSLSGAAQRLGQGDLAQRVPSSGPAELRKLSDTFNTMAENLETAEQQRRSLTADLAHELRTPLSNIQGYLDAVHDGLLEPDEATINTLRQQAAHLVALVEDLRLLALAEAGSLALNLQRESLRDLLQESVEAFRPRADAGGISLTLSAPGELPSLEVDRTRISQVVGNLLENAIVNTPEGGEVRVSAAREGEYIAVSIADTGAGIAPEDLERIFDRMYRVDPSRARATGGAGLGLTIARHLVQVHGGAITVSSIVGQGSAFTFTLPLNRGDC